MENNFSRVDVYNEDYVGLNHAYVQMYKFYNRLLEVKDADDEVLTVIKEILLIFNPTLDKIKSEMTIKTRYKEELSANAQTQNQNEAEQVRESDASVILHGNFTGD